jgi:SAM-dependent methyltransferase
VLSLARIPVLINAQVRPEDAPAVQRGDMELVVCRACAHLYNRAFDESLLDYDASYENTLHYSEHFQRHARELARRLVDAHGLEGATVAELGSGPGHFLSMLCEAGVAKAIGFDPSYDASRLGAPTNEAVSVSTELFPADGSLPVAMAFSQHVLEHLESPVDALRALRAAVADTGGVVYTEVPNGDLMLRDCALWDLIYEHRSYFVEHSLRVACERAGLRTERLGTSFGEQFLWSESIPVAESTGSSDDVPIDAAVSAAIEFGLAARERLESARDELAQYVAAGPVVLWGAGSKGATYLNLVGDTAAIAGVVDINPRKRGWGVPGTTLTISGPAALTEIGPRTVLVANPIYIDEIGAKLSDIGVRAEVRALWGTEE